MTERLQTHENEEGIDIICMIRYHALVVATDLLLDQVPSCEHSSAKSLCMLTEEGKSVQSASKAYLFTISAASFSRITKNWH